MVIQAHDILWVGIGMFVNLIQPFLIIFVPFWNAWKYRQGLTIAFSFALILAGTAVFCILPERVLTYQFLQTWKTGMILPSWTLMFLFTGKSNRAKVMYFVLIITVLVISVLKLANYAVLRFLEDPSHFDFTVAYIMTHIITTPLMIVHINRLVKKTVPIVEPSGEKIWGIVWVVPMLFLIINFAFNLEFDLDMITTPAFVISNVLSIVGVLVSSYIVYRALQMAAETATLKQGAELALLRAENAEKDLKLQKQLAASIPPESLIVCYPFTLNTAVRQAFMKGTDIDLKDKEFELLAYFISRENETVSNDEIYRAVWKQPYHSTDRALKGALQRLREKVSGSGYCIRNTRGKGYSFERE
jgi:hypothetical protein